MQRASGRARKVEHAAARGRNSLAGGVPDARRVSSSVGCGLGKDADAFGIAAVIDTASYALEYSFANPGI